MSKRRFNKRKTATTTAPTDGMTQRQRERAKRALLKRRRDKSHQ